MYYGSYKENEQDSKRQKKMITVRCKVIEQGEYSVVISLSERLVRLKTRRSKRFPIIPQYLCVIAKMLLYSFPIKDKIESDVTQVLYFDKPLPEELDLVNDPDISVFLQTSNVNIDVLAKMQHEGTSISYENY